LPETDNNNPEVFFLRTEIEEKTKEIAKLKEVFDEKKNEDLKRILPTLNKEIKEKANLKHEIEVLSKEIKMKSQEIEVKNKEIIEKIKVIEAKNKELDEKNAIILEKDEEILNKNIENQDFSSLKKELSLKAQELASKSQEIAFFNQEDQAKSKELSLLNSKNEELLKSLNSLSQEKVLLEQKIIELQDREHKLLQQNNQKTQDFKRQTLEIQSKYEESLKMHSETTEELNSLRIIFNREMEEKAREEVQFLKKLILLNNYEILRKNEAECKLEIVQLKEKIAELEKGPNYKAENMKLMKELKLYKNKELSMNSGLQLITEKYRRTLDQVKEKISKKFGFLEEKVLHLQEILAQIEPLLKVLRKHIGDKEFKGKNLLKLLIQAIMTHNCEKRLEKHGFSQISPEKTLKETPITLKSTAETSIIRKKPEISFKIEKNAGIIEDFEEIVDGKVSYFTNKGLFDIMEKNLVNSWKFFDIMQEILLSFKGLILENRQGSKFLIEIKRIFDGLLMALQRKNDEFQQKVKNCKDLMKNNKDLKVEFMKNMEFGGDLIETIYGKKGSFNKS